MCKLVIEEDKIVTVEQCSKCGCFRQWIQRVDGPSSKSVQLLGNDCRHKW